MTGDKLGLLGGLLLAAASIKVLIVELEFVM